MNGIRNESKKKIKNRNGRPGSVTMRLDTRVRILTVPPTITTLPPHPGPLPLGGGGGESSAGLGRDVSLPPPRRGGEGRGEGEGWCCCRDAPETRAVSTFGRP